MARIAIPTMERDPAMMLSALIRDCLAYHTSVRGYSHATTENYDRTFRQFLAHTHALGLRDELASFNDGTAFSFMEALGKAGAVPNTITNKLSALSSLATYGMRARDSRGRPLMSHNPVKTFEWPRCQSANIDVLRPDEVRALLELPLPPGRAIIRDLLFDTGLRVSELACATVGDVTEVNGAWFLEVTLKSRGRKRRQQFPLSHDVAAGLRDYLLSRGAVQPGDPLLARADGHAYTRSYLGWIVAWMGRDAGITRIRLSPHKLRHMVNIWARMGGADVYQRSRLLGHASTTALSHYEHLIPNELYGARQQQREGMRQYVGGSFVPAPASPPALTHGSNT